MAFPKEPGRTNYFAHRRAGRGPGDEASTFLVPFKNKQRPHRGLGTSAQTPRVRRRWGSEGTQLRVLQTCTEEEFQRQEVPSRTALLSEDRTGKWRQRAGERLGRRLWVLSPGCALSPMPLASCPAVSANTGPWAGPSSRAPGVWEAESLTYLTRLTMLSRWRSPCPACWPTFERLLAVGVGEERGPPSHCHRRAAGGPVS